MISAYRQLLRIAQDQLDLAVAGHWDELPAAMERWQRCTAVLPDAPPPAAWPLLDRLGLLQRELEARMRAARADIGRELTTLQRDRASVRGYQGSALVRGLRIDDAA